MDFNKDSNNYKDWLDIALSDFLSAPSLYEGDLLEQACTMSYQSVEKSMKAFLVYKTGTSPMTHNLGYLLHLITGMTDELDDFSDIATEFDGYYFDLRYPSSDGVWVDDDITENLITLAGEFYNRIEWIIETIETERQNENITRYGKYRGYNKWDLTVDRLYMNKEGFYNKYGFEWYHNSRDLLNEAKRYMLYHMGIDCDGGHLG